MASSDFGAAERPSESILHRDPDRRRHDNQLSEDKRRGQTHKAAVSTARNPARQREEAAC